MADTNARVKEQNPEANATVIMTMVATAWSALASDKKDTYLEKAEKLKDDFNEAMKVYEATKTPVVAGEASTDAASAPHVYRMWMEDRTTKKQWELLLSEDLSLFGPVGIPTATVFSFLASGLEEREILASSSISDAVAARPGEKLYSSAVPQTVAQAVVSNKASVPVEVSITETVPCLTLRLAIQFSPLWIPTFQFPLKVVDVDSMQVLEARLRDVEEKLALGKEELAVANLKSDELRHEINAMKSSFLDFQKSGVNRWTQRL